MSFAILRHGKISSTSKGAAIAHNHRTGNVDQVNIDGAMKHLNRCFMGEGLAARIDALLPEKIRKDAVVAVEVLLTSGPEFFDGIEKDRTKLSKNPRFLDWVQKTLNWAKNEFGGNLVDATLHMDESTPHIHLMAVPLTKDGRLCAKEVMARSELQRRQTGYAEAMRPFGLVRGEPAAETKRRHIGLKEDAGSGGKAAQVQAQLDRAKADLLRLQKLSKEWSDTDLAKIRVLEAALKETKAEADKVPALIDTLEKIKASSVALKAWSKDSIFKMATEAQAQISSANNKVEAMKNQITQLEAQNAKLAADKAKFAAMATAYQAEKVAGTPAHLIAPDAHVQKQPMEPPKQPSEAFLAKWQGLAPATRGDIAVGVVVALEGRHAVFHVGRGRHVMYQVPDGLEIPKKQETQQQKGGFER